MESCPFNNLSSVSYGMVSGSISWLRMDFRIANAPALEFTELPSLQRGLKMPAIYQVLYYENGLDSGAYI